LALRLRPSRRTAAANSPCRTYSTFTVASRFVAFIVDSCNIGFFIGCGVGDNAVSDGVALQIITQGESFRARLADAHAASRLVFFGELDGCATRGPSPRTAPFRKKNWFVCAKPPLLQRIRTAALVLAARDAQEARPADAQ